MENVFNQKILLVDDRPENILVLENILEGPNREFVKAESGEEALSLLLKNDISLILLDVQMPGIDGFETAKLIVGAQKTKHIPIIFVTAISREQKHIFQGYEAGAVDYLRKPLEPEIVKSKVKIFLELDRQRRLLEFQNDELVAAKKNTDNILANVEEGLFLINRNYEIKPQYSDELERTLETDKLAGENILSLLKGNMNDEIFNNTSMYLELMFRDDIDGKLIDELNPLQKIEYHANPKSKAKYLSFNFKRVQTNGTFDELIATVTDNTEQIKLSKKLEETEEKSKIQLELLNIIHSEPLLLKEYLLQTENELKLVQEKLTNNNDEKDPGTAIEVIYQAIHSVKGNSALLKFSFLADKAHQFEEILINIKDQPSHLAGKTSVFKSLLKEMNYILSEIKDLIEKLAEFNKQFSSKSSHDGELLINTTQNIIKQLSKELDKKVKLDHAKFKKDLIPAGNSLVIKDILVQLSRNAMYHGIEHKDDRKKLKKSVVATITMASEIDKNMLTLKFEDDGKGLQIDRIREKAVESGQWKKADLMKMNDKQITGLIFESGISTAEKSDLIAGRGIGMSIIKQKIEQLGGKLQVDSETGKFSRFIISLPVN